MDMKFNIEKYHQSMGSFFDFLSEIDAQRVKKKMIRKELQKGDFVFKEGNRVKGIYLVAKGKIKLFQLTRDGKQIIIYIYKKGDFFGYRPLLSEESLSISACAMEQVVLSIVPRETFYELLQTSSFFAKKMLVHMSKEFSVWINRMSFFNTYSVRERVAMSLLILNTVYRRKDDLSDKPTTISISRDDLAAFAGTAKETLVRMLRTFKDQKIIVTKGSKIMVTHQANLFKLLSDI